MIGLCTDSNSQLPADLIARFDAEVVPLTVIVDGVEFAEGEDLDADGFYARFDRDHTPVVSTSQPSPGRFALAYRAVAERGARQILSVHVGSAVSGTLNSARIAAETSPVPVRLVDTGTASFGISCCLWAAAEAIEDGATIDDAAHVAESLVPHIGNVFVVRALDLVRAGGRVGSSVEDAARDPAGAVPILTLRDGKVEVVAMAANLDDAVGAMSTMIVGAGDDLRVAVGVADAAARPLSDALIASARSAANITDCVTYRVGPSIGAHTGPGTAGAFFFTAPSRGPR
jgi:DegV family protein with EDD domain